MVSITVDDLEPGMAIRLAGEDVVYIGEEDDRLYFKPEEERRQEYSCCEFKGYICWRFGKDAVRHCSLKIIERNAINFEKDLFEKVLSLLKEIITTRSK